MSSTWCGCCGSCCGKDGGGASRKCDTSGQEKKRATSTRFGLFAEPAALPEEVKEGEEEEEEEEEEEKEEEAGATAAVPVCV
jgi:hypothetical protein